jgi:hypothetical protein
MVYMSEFIKMKCPKEIHASWVRDWNGLSTAYSHRYNKVRGYNMGDTLVVPLRMGWAEPIPGYMVRSAPDCPLPILIRGHKVKVPGQQVV